MKKYLLFLLVFLALKSEAQTTQYGAKRLIAGDSMMINGKWVKKIATDLNTADSLADNVIPSAKAVVDFVRTHLGLGGSDSSSDIRDTIGMYNVGHGITFGYLVDDHSFAINNGYADSGIILDKTSDSTLHWRLDPAMIPTGSNGISKIGNVFQIGGTLSKIDTIDAGGYGLLLKGTNVALYLNSTATGLQSIGTNIGGSFLSSSIPLFGTNQNSGTNTVGVGLLLSRSPSISGVNQHGIAGLGISIRADLANSAGTQTESSGMVTTLTNVNAGIETSRYDFNLLNAGALATKLSIYGNGGIQAQSYGSGANTGTIAYVAGFTSDGHLIEVPTTGVGSTTLAGLTDISVSSPSNLQLLQYLTSDSKWHAFTPNWLKLSDSAAMLSPYLHSADAAALYFAKPTGTSSQFIKGDGSLGTSATFSSPNSTIAFSGSTTITADVAHPNFRTTATASTSTTMTLSVGDIVNYIWMDPTSTETVSVGTTPGGTDVVLPVSISSTSPLIKFVGFRASTGLTTLYITVSNSTVITLIGNK